MKLCRLDEVCDFQSGLWTGKKGPYKVVKVLRNTNFTKDNKLNLENIAEIKVEVKQFEKRVLEKGDILIEKSGGGPNQPVGRVVLIDKRAVDYSFSNFTSRIRVSSGDLNPNYLYWFLNYIYLSGKTENLQRRSTGIRNLQLKEYKQLVIPVPTLQEQEKTVKRLDMVFENIESILRNNDLKKKLYSDYFESISWDEVIENQKFPKNPISDFFELDPSKSEISNENLDEVSFIPMADVDELIFEVDSKQIKDYKQVKKGYKYFANGDFLLAKITPCFENGKMGQVNNLKNKIGFGSTEFIVHRSNGKILNEWLFLLYSNSRIRKKLASTMSGAVGHKRVSKETISNLQISSPTIEEQKKIINKLFIIKKTIDKKISIIDQEIIKYSSLKKSILGKEFSYE